MRSITTYIRQHHLALVALFFAVGGGAAWAANTIGSADIIDGEVKAADIATDAVRSAEISGGQVRSSDVADDSTPHALGSADIAEESLTSADVDESTLSGSRIVARVRGTSSQYGGGIVASTYPNGAAFPLDDNTWVQAPDEIEREVVGEVTFSYPYTCGDPSVGDASLYVTLNGDLFPYGEQFKIKLGSTASNEKRVFSAPIEDFEPGVATPHTLTAKVSDSCESGHVHVSALAVDVIGIR